MRKKDKLFIFLSMVLVMLFIASILENLFLSTSDSFHSNVARRISPDRLGILLFERPRPKVGGVENDIDNKILTSLEKAGLRPREAKYYE